MLRNISQEKKDFKRQLKRRHLKAKPDSIFVFQFLFQDGSLAVTYGFADIQGNTFETFIGKPFKEFRPLQRQVSQ